MKNKTLWKYLGYFTIFAVVLALLAIAMPFIAVAGGVGTWCYSKKQVDAKKKAISLVMLGVGLVGSIVLTPQLFNKQGDSNNTELMTDGTISPVTLVEKSTDSGVDASETTATSSEEVIVDKEESKIETVEVKEITFDNLLNKQNEDELVTGEVYTFTVSLIRESNWGKNSDGYTTVLVTSEKDEGLFGEIYVNDNNLDNWKDGTVVKFTVEVKELEKDSIQGKFKTIELVAVDSEIISGGTSKEEKEVAKKAKEEAKQAALLDSLNEHKNWLNEEVGTEAILSISEITTGAYRVNLSYDFLSLSTAEIKVIVNLLNKQLVYIVYQQGFDYASFTYYIEGTKIGENRRVMNPSEVKFNKVLN